MRRVDRGLFIGRFQPFHLGHLEAAKYILSRMDEVIIAIGSAQYSHTLDNPFTAGERVEMIRGTLDVEGVDPRRYYLVPVEDVNVHSVWVAHVASRVPRFHTVYSNEPLTRRLFEEAGYRVEPIPFYERNRYSATEIRRRILEGEAWEELVPSSVAEFIKSIDGDHRIRVLASTDKPKPGESGDNLHG
ncbi:MAG: nicotinamide-nucleotide adenylyltransferase [Candidatus Bathyarchaeia archaeon]